jgi:hypothetical protein
MVLGFLDSGPVVGRIPWQQQLVGEDAHPKAVRKRRAWGKTAPKDTSQ